MRPNPNSGSTITGMATGTKPDKPRARHHHHGDRGRRTACEIACSAVDTGLPTADLIWVVSAVSRETSSPDLAVSKKSSESFVKAVEHGATQIGDGQLAERGHEVVARRAREREHAATAIITAKC